MTTEKRRIALAVTGSVAAYKSAELARMFISRGYEVRVIMTPSAREFISPLTMRALTGKSVITDFWDGSESAGMDHIAIADWADAVVIAPATANVISKLAMGFADNVVTAIALATRSPLVVAPAMNVNMFTHPKTQENIEELKKRGVSFINPEKGELACGWTGDGRLAHPWEIFYGVRRVLSLNDFKGKKIVITTGPTREAIDPVRYLSNRSSGKMGAALARHAFRRGADVTLIHGPISVRVPRDVHCIPVTTAEEMHTEVFNQVSKKTAPDIVIMAAAVADFRPSDQAKSKLKKSEGMESIALTRNPDILADVGKAKEGSGMLLVGFAVETGELEDLLSEVRKKLKEKRADLMIGNFAEDAFDLNTNRVWLIDRTGRQEEVATTYKGRVANKILDAIARIR